MTPAEVEGSAIMKRRGGLRRNARTKFIPSRGQRNGLQILAGSLSEPMFALLLAARRPCFS